MRPPPQSKINLKMMASPSKNGNMVRPMTNEELIWYKEFKEKGHTIGIFQGNKILLLK